LVLCLALRPAASGPMTTARSSFGGGLSEADLVVFTATIAASGHPALCY